MNTKQVIELLTIFCSSQTKLCRVAHANCPWTGQHVDLTPIRPPPLFQPPILYSLTFLFSSLMKRKPHVRHLQEEGLDQKRAAKREICLRVGDSNPRVSRLNAATSFTWRLPAILMNIGRLLPCCSPKSVWDMAFWSFLCTSCVIKWQDHESSRK